MAEDNHDDALGAAFAGLNIHDQPVRQMYRGIHFHADFFNEAEREGFERLFSDYQSKFERTPILCHSLLGHDLKKDVYLNFPHQEGTPFAFEEDNVIVDNLLALRVPVQDISLGKFTYQHRFDALLQAYYGDYSVFRREFNAAPQRRTNAANIFSRIRPLFFADSPFVSCSLELRGAVLQATGAWNPTRLGKLDDTALAPGSLVGFVFVIEVDENVFQDMINRDRVLDKQRLSRENRVHPNHNQSFVEEFTWLGYVPGQYVRGAIPIRKPANGDTYLTTAEAALNVLLG